jgi:hypothetical protein
MAAVNLLMHLLWLEAVPPSQLRVPDSSRVVDTEFVIVVPCDEMSNLPTLSNAVQRPAREPSFLAMLERWWARSTLLSLQMP